MNVYVQEVVLQCCKNIAVRSVCLQTSITEGYRGREGRKEEGKGEEGGQRRGRKKEGGGGGEGKLEWMEYE